MRSLPLLVVLLIFTLTTPKVQGELASKTESDRVCINWLAQAVYDYGPWAGSDQPQIANTWELRTGNRLLARCYDINPRGFIVVPELKALPPIKAYSDESALNNQQQDGFLALLTESIEQKIRLYELQNGSVDASVPPN